MYKDGSIVIAKTEAGEEISIQAKMANRHGLITGATGTGKTTTLKAMAESFSDMGVPVFFSDIKGDLQGMAKTHPVTFWDIYGKDGIPARTTISEMGPILLTKLMDLNDTQASVLTVVFKIADDRGLLLIDTKDLKAMLSYVGDNGDEFKEDYGNIAKSSCDTIIRNIVALESKGADQFFSEPALNIVDFFQNGSDGKGMINILECGQLINDTTLYSSFLLWMLSELFETLPEVGDMDKPRMVFFFDEAHLLFKDINKGLMEKIEQVVKLIRSKGVGVYFISQSPKDIPDSILAQLGNKIQHGLRAYTPADEKVVKTVADTFRTNPELNTYETILALGTGEVVCSFLEEGGIPGMVKKAKVIPPVSMDQAISPEEKKQHILMSNTYLRYQNMVDRDSAYEFFQRVKTTAKAQEDEEKARAEEEKVAAAEAKEQAKLEAQEAKALEKQEAQLRKQQEMAEAKALKEQEKAAKATKTQMKKVASSAAGTIGRELGKSLGKSVGGDFGKTLGGNVGAQLGRSILGTFLK